LLVTSLSKTQLARKQNATEMAGRSGVASGDPEYLEGNNSDNDDDDDVGGATAAV
jgi:hypothetical protein